MPPSVKDSLGSDFLTNLKLPNVNSSTVKKKDSGLISLRGSVEQQQNDPLEQKDSLAKLLHDARL